MTITLFITLFLGILLVFFILLAIGKTLPIWLMSLFGEKFYYRAYKWKMKRLK